jgi:hypothetical protein
VLSAPRSDPRSDGPKPSGRTPDAALRFALPRLAGRAGQPRPGPSLHFGLGRASFTFSRLDVTRTRR